MRPARDIASETLLALNMINSRTFQYLQGLIGLHLQLMLKLWRKHAFKPRSMQVHNVLSPSPRDY